MSVIIDVAKRFRKWFRLRGNYTLIDRSEGKKKLCILLCGYKEFLWEEYFGRLKMFSDSDIDFCILSSGIYSEKLDSIAKEFGWSYLYTKRNDVVLIQNIAINCFPNAKYIYKLDEDIIICNNFFKNLFETYINTQEKGQYHVGVVAPLLPVNGFGYIHVLKRLNRFDDYEKKFGRAQFGSNKDDQIMVNPDCSKYMWNLTYNIDDLAKQFESSNEIYPCFCRFSIGAILFSRDLWEQMGMFKADFSNGLGNDEVQLCAYCMTSSKTFIVAGNTLAGHFSFGPQNKAMEEAYKKDQMFSRLCKSSN